MNREIKFRAWDGIRMTTSGIMFNCSNSSLEVPEGSQMKIMQFTGLKDKNGKEVYESDILSHYDGSIIVKYEDDYAGFNICYSIHECIVMNDNIEVIGNIYENSELLK